ncbi:MAG: hypothetical protein KF715_18165 [Candidatus Didemnitutus sp.]|nr:hypothetical protein [Candidatus Didemnitutus sp.]
MQIALVVLIVLVVIGLIVLGRWVARQRTKAMAALAARLGLGFRADEDPENAARLEFLDKLDQGSNRYLFNCLDGVYQGERVMAFDYHYETYSHSKGGRQTHHHYFTVVMLVLPRSFPELLISPEGLLSKLAQAVGYEDIDFESAEFSRAFCVRSPDKKFAYDVCHGLMMEYLLRHRDLSIELEGNVLALLFDSRLEPDEIERRLGELLEIRRLLPEYLFSSAP